MPEPPPELYLPDAEYILTTERAEQVLQELLARKLEMIGLDIETFGPSKKAALDPMHGTIRLVQISDGAFVWVFDCTEISLSVFKPLLEAPVLKVIHNAKFESKFFLRAGITIQPVMCTLLLSQITLTELGEQHGLAPVTLATLGIPRDDKKFQKVSWQGPITQEMFIYAKDDALHLPRIHQSLLSIVEKEGLESIVALEHDFLPMVIDMEEVGILPDLTKWEQVEARVAQLIAETKVPVDQVLMQYTTIEAIDTALSGIASRPRGTEVNWDSTAHQVKPVLALLGVEVPNCQRETLEAIVDPHPIISPLIEHRKALALKNGLSETKWRGFLGTDGRIHPSWNQNQAVTGRMSCSDPNLQNIPRDKECRELIIAAPGHCLPIDDFSQIEMRVLAEMSQDPVMIKVLNDGLDLHRWLAAELLEIPISEVSKSDRDWAKTLGFAVVYGMGNDSLARSMSLQLKREVSPKKAQGYIDSYFRTFPGVAKWRARQQRLLVPTGRWVMKKGGDSFPEKKGVCRSLWGRKLTFYSKTKSMNYPVQASAADALKLVCVELWRTRDQAPGSRVVALIHDELLVETVDTPEAIAACLAWLHNGVSVGLGKILKTIPTGLDDKPIQVVHNWSETL